jgi:hypothetical protein
MSFFRLLNALFCVIQEIKTKLIEQLVENNSFKYNLLTTKTI